MLTSSPSLPWQVRLRLSALRGVEQARVALGKGGTVRVGPWIVLCQAETPRLTPAGDVVTHVDGGDQGLITSAIIAQVARVYDPRIHRAAIVATEVGNPHFCGEAEAPAGWIERLVATATHLWGLVVECVDEDGQSRMEKWIGAGWLHRSVHIGPRSDVEGGLYLRHLALSSGYPEGQGGNPLLSWYWPDALKLEAPGPRLEAFDSAGMFRLAYEPTGGTPPQEESPMDPAEVKSIIQEAMGTMIEKIDAMGKATTEQMAANAEAVKEQVAAVESRLAKVEERVETGSKSDVEKTMRLSVQSLVDQGRLAPADADAEVKELLALPGDLATSRLSRLAERTPINGGKMLVLPDGMKQRILAKKKGGTEVKRTSDGIEAAAREAGYIAADAKPQDVLKGMDRFVREAAAEAGA